MAVIKSASGEPITIGSFAGGYPTLTSWGDGIPSPDRGTPLRMYSPHNTDPLTIWKTQPSVRKVCGFAARQIAALSWHAYQRVDDRDRQRRSSSEAERILETPAKLVTGYHLFETLVIDKMLYDVCLAVLADGELVRIPPKLIRIKSDALGRPRQVIINTPAGMKDLDVTDAPKILSFGWHSDKAGGVPPLQTLAAILNENLRSVEWRTKQWANSPKMSGILARPQAAAKWETGARDSFLESWRTWRDTNAGGTPILEDGMEYRELNGLNPKDARDIEGRRLTDAEVASAYFIPPELVGAREGNFSNMDAFRQMLFGPTLGPTIVELQQAINGGGIVEALDVTPGVYIEANRDGAMAGSFLEQARVLQTMTGGPVMTRAEGRARLNLPWIEGTDELIVPLNVTEGGQASPTDSGTQNLGGDNADPDARLDQ